MNGHEALCWATAFAIVVATIWCVVWSIILYRNRNDKYFDESWKIRISHELSQIKDKLEKEQL